MITYGCLSAPDYPYFNAIMPFIDPSWVFTLSACLRPEVNTLVDYNAFMESVARRIDCEPRLLLNCLLIFNLHILTLTMGLYGWMSPSLRTSLWAMFLWIVTILLFFVVEDGQLIKWWLFPRWSVWYRQRGPGANQKVFLDTLRSVSVWRDIHCNARFALFVG